MYYYCSILLQHVLSLIYIHPWHHICLLRITYPDLSLFYFSGYLVIQMIMRLFWSFILICIDIYSLKINWDLHSTRNLWKYVIPISNWLLKWIQWCGCVQGRSQRGGRGAWDPPLPQELHWSPHKPPYKFEEEERENRRRDEEEEQESSLELNPASATGCTTFFCRALCFLSSIHVIWANVPPILKYIMQRATLRKDLQFIIPKNKDPSKILN